MNNNRQITLSTNKNIVVEFTDERIIPAGDWLLSAQSSVKAILLKSSIGWMSQPIVHSIRSRMAILF